MALIALSLPHFSLPYLIACFTGMQVAILIKMERTSEAEQSLALLNKKMIRYAWEDGWGMEHGGHEMKSVNMARLMFRSPLRC